jgi:hypothetical protein
MNGLAKLELTKLLWLAPLLAGACEQGAMSTIVDPPKPRAPAELVPEQAQVDGGELTVGVKLGKLRNSVSVESFAITRQAVSVTQYGQCVDTGGCSPPAWDVGECMPGSRGIDGPTFQYRASAGQLPVTCVTPEQATDYCAWVGARLPTAEQWLLAARGKEVTRYGWGDAAPSCGTHLRDSMLHEAPCCGVDCTSPEAITGRFAQVAAAPAGRIDRVLWTHAELARGDEKSKIRACRSPEHGCWVHGSRPGSIDSFAPVPGNESSIQDLEISIRAAAFRCAWEV